jgi:hypothetical protein
MAQYTTLDPTGDIISYVPQYEANYGYSVTYPDSDVVATFGPILTPKIFADGLDTLEIASSGKIAATLNNEHAFDIVELGRTVHFTARYGNSFLFGTEEGQASIFIGDDLSNVAVFSSNDFTATARDFLFAASNDFSVAADKDVLIASANESVSVSAKLDFSVAASNDVVVAAERKASFSASNDLSLSTSRILSVQSALGSYFAAGDELRMTAATDFDIDALRDFRVNAARDGYVAASNALFIEAAASNVVLRAGDTFSAAAASNVDVTATQGTLTQTAGSNIVAAAASNVQVTATQGTLTQTAGSNIVAAAASNVTFEATQGTLTQTAGSNIVAAAASNVTFEATKGTLAQTAGSNIVAAAASNVQVTATQGTLTQTAGSNIVAAAASNVDVTATQGTLTQTAGSNIVAVAASNVTFEATQGTLAQTAGSNIVAVAASNVELTATQGTLAQTAGSNIVAVAASNVTFEATQGTLAQTAGSNIVAVAASNVTFEATQGTLAQAAGKHVSTVAASNIYATAGNDYSLYSSNAMLLVSKLAAQFTSSDGDLLISAPMGTLTLDAANINLGGSGAGGLVSQKDVNIGSINSNVNIGAGIDFVAHAARDVDVAASNEVRVTSVAGDVAVEAGVDAAVSAARDVVLAAGRDVNRFSARDIRDAASNDILFAASNDIRAAAIGGYSVETLVDSLTLTSGKDASVTAASNVFVRAVQKNVDVESGSNVAVRAGVDFSLSAASNITVGSKAMAFSTSGGNLTMSANESAKQVWQIGGQDVLELYKTQFYDSDAASNATPYKLVVRADLEIQGGINSIGVNETFLNVENKNIHLAYDSNAQYPFDGTVNSGAGIVVDGVPESWVVAGEEAGTGFPASRYEKSFKWKTPTADGTRNMGDANIANEPFWEVRGGHLKITHQEEASGQEVSFGFRVNDRKELEIYRQDTLTGKTHVVSRMGRVM